MRKLSIGVIGALISVMWLVGASALAQQTVPAEHKKNAEKAMAVLNNMTAFLSRIQRFSVTADTGFDAVQADGQKIEFGETRKVLLRRPDHLRIEETKRNGSKSELLFDGKTISLWYVKDQVYATADKPGTVDEAILYFTDNLGMRLPLAEFLSAGLASTLPQEVQEAAYVESAQISGVPCDHVAFRGAQSDLQLWVAQGDKPLPRRVVITYRREDGRPQFWAQFSDWNLNPKVSDSQFAFKPPKDANRIEFSPRQMMQTETVKK